MKKFLVLMVLSMVVVFSAIASGSGDTYGKGQEDKDEILDIAAKVVPVPQVTNFLERINVARRAKVMDQPNKLFYVYLFNYGVENPIAYIVLQGKVSSLRSYLVPQERIRYGNVVQDADIDGTYGENSSGIFGFTAAGAYFEWNIGILVMDTPIAIFNVPDITESYNKSQGK